MCDFVLDIVQNSVEAEGTKVEFSFPRANVDCPPVGDVPGTFGSALCFPGNHELAIRRRRAAAAGTLALDYELKRGELAEALGGLERGYSLVLLREFLESQEQD